MTHEIRSPLNAILGYAQILKYEDKISNKHKEQLETIIKSGEHLLEIVNEVLEMSKIESGILDLNLDNFDFYNLMEDINKIFKIKMQKKGLYFEITIEKEVPKILFSDNIKIKQVIINLVNNAFKFTEKGYVKLKVNVDNSKEKIFVLVEDNGIGISNEEKEKIFLPFEQTKSGKFLGGVGLGLVISKKFANLLGGDITFVSDIGKGSSFIFEFKYQIGDPLLI